MTPWCWTLLASNRKTGTLTLEQPLISHIHTFEGYAEETVLGYAAAAEKRQSHPIAKAILQEATTRVIDLPAVNEASYQIGYGLTVQLAGDLAAQTGNQADLSPIIRVGSCRFIEQEGIILAEEVHSSVYEAKEQGNSIVLVAINKEVVGAIELQSAIRPESAAVVQWLKAQGKEIVIISGDHTQPTHALAKALGIEHYFAETLPEEKDKLIEQLQNDGKRVCFPPRGREAQCRRWHQRHHRHEKILCVSLATRCHHRRDRHRPSRLNGGRFTTTHRTF